MLAAQKILEPIRIESTPDGLFCMECLDSLSCRYHMQMQLIGHSAVGFLPEDLEPLQVALCQLHVPTMGKGFFCPVEGLQAANNRSKGHLAMRLQRVAVKGAIYSPQFCEGSSWPIKVGYNEHLLDGPVETLFLDIVNAERHLGQAYTVLRDMLRQAASNSLFWKDCWKTYLADVRKTQGREETSRLLADWKGALPKIMKYLGREG